MKILIAGDYCLRGRALDAVEKNEGGLLWGKVSEILKDVDYSICNFEAPVVLSEGASPIMKEGPALKHRLSAVTTLKDVGFNCVTLANNHFYDYGDIGVADTLKSLKKHDIDYVGGGIDIDEASRILYKNIKGKNIAIVNACEHEFSIATKLDGGSNPLDIISQTRDIQEAKGKAGFVIVIIHGGSEHYQYPTERMVKTYRYFIDMGANVVINHHQHCYSGYESYNGGMIFYGLGNFCFDSHAHAPVPETWKEGYMVSLNIQEKSFSYRLIPYRQCTEKAEIEIVDDTDFNVSVKEINAVIADEDALKQKFEEFTQKTASQNMAILTPYTNRYLLALWRRGLLPSFISKRKILSLLNQINCEAHRDRCINTLQRKVSEYRGNKHLKI